MSARGQKYEKLMQALFCLSCVAETVMSLMCWYFQITSTRRHGNNIFLGLQPLDNHKAQDISYETTSKLKNVYKRICFWISEEIQKFR